MSNPQFQELLKDSTPSSIQKSSDDLQTLALPGSSSEKPTGFVERVQNQLNSIQN